MGQFLSQLTEAKIVTVSKFIYESIMLFGFNKSLLDKLESVLRTDSSVSSPVSDERTTARLVLQKWKFDSISLNICDHQTGFPLANRLWAKICSIATKNSRLSSWKIGDIC